MNTEDVNGNKNYNPIYEAHNILLSLQDDPNIENLPPEIEDAIGFLGEALE